MPDPQSGDRFRHKKYGLGTAKAYYPKNDGVRMEFDSGHKTVCARTRLIPVTPELSDEQRASTESADVRVTRSRSAGSAKVDYQRMDMAKKHFEKLYPDAKKVVPKIYGERIYVEVWAEQGGAQIVFYDPPVEKKRGREKVAA